MMTRKDFETMAAILGTIENPRDRGRVASVFMTVADRSNPRFDHKRFREAVDKYATLNGYSKEAD